METTCFGRTGLIVSRTGFGALPIQRISKNDAVYLLHKALDNGITLFDTARGYSDSEEKLALIDACTQQNMGVLAMKALSGGLITHAQSAFAHLYQYETVVPIWGIQREAELDEFIALSEDPPDLDSSLESIIAGYTEELQGEFCRACGYCLPCPAEIQIPMAARISLLLNRAVAENFTTPAWQEKMERVNDCIECGTCIERCPYDLDTPSLLKKNLACYREYLASRADRKDT